MCQVRQTLDDLTTVSDSLGTYPDGGMECWNRAAGQHIWRETVWIYRGPCEGDERSAQVDGSPQDARTEVRIENATESVFVY